MKVYFYGKEYKYNPNDSIECNYLILEHLFKIYKIDPERTHIFYYDLICHKKNIKILYNKEYTKMEEIDDNDIFILTYHNSG